MLNQLLFVMLVVKLSCKVCSLTICVNSLNIQKYSNFELINECKSYFFAWYML